jgi:hypothetical protein
MIKINKLLIILLILCSYQNKLFSQTLLSKYDNNSFVSFEKQIFLSDTIFHSSIRQISIPELRRSFNYDSVYSSYKITKFKKSKITDVLFNRNLIILSKPDYGFTIDPLFDFEYGYDFQNNHRSWLNTRGILIEGYIGKTISFSSSFYENQALPPLWIRDYTMKRHVMPGQGGVKGFGNEGFDFASSSGYVNWAPSKFFNFRLGHGKNFLGDGYRSMILSDFSSSYPYFMLTATYWKIKYISLTSQFSHPDVTDHTNSDGSSVFAKKTGLEVG